MDGKGNPPDFRKLGFYAALGGVAVAAVIIWMLSGGGYAVPASESAYQAEIVIRADDGGRSATPDTIVVYITGEVADPGVYEIERGARIAAVLELAGGALGDADLGAVNLSKKADDEEHIVIPKAGESLATRETSGLININAAGRDELMTLPGVGGVTADEIIRHREEHGPFQNARELTEVFGVGEKTYERLSAYITAE
ncbi:MAG: ComEA family DNA-binding protein [Clostridiales bacterium]|jgi:competence protein ComEA|nr:ComEA family DNA-binding protein [Clostridiales bacterium]